MSPHFIVQNGAYVLDVPCPKCSATDGWRCYPGEWPSCKRCDVQVLTYGRTPRAPCVTPNGRIDSHMKYVRAKVRRHGFGIRDSVCAFCGKA